ncbi:hypothetical protein JTB14_028711 [Gonioctena quinquepunctata]|nr:hypothetical protein JTB14_028711 [Gonioctena quinquepunctata]
MGCFLCKEKGHLAANCPNINIANELTSDNTQTENIGNDPPVATNIQTEQTPESPQPGQKRGPTESVDDSDSPEPHSSKLPNGETPLMPPPARAAAQEIPKHARKKPKKSSSDIPKISEASEKTIRDLFSNDPSKFSIPVNNLLAFLENSFDCSNPWKEAQHFPDNIESLLSDMHIIYPHLTKRSLKNRFSRITKKLKKEVEPDMDERSSLGSQSDILENEYQSDSSQS